MSDETAKAIAAELRRLADNLSDEWSPKQTRAWLRRRAGVISREPGKFQRSRPANAVHLD